MKDKAGRTIKPGDIVVYGKALGRSAGMQYGLVTGVVKTRDRWSDKLVEKLQFIGVDDGWDEKRSLQKPSTLSFGDRILVVTRDQVEKAALKLLDTIDEKEFK